jgi:2-dehydro-3-deoxy-D-gluconate 5-dehydrogenase
MQNVASVFLLGRYDNEGIHPGEELEMKPFDLSGKVAVVTGGNGGIGLGMARGLAAAGAKVVVAGRNARKSAAAAKEIGGIAIEADVLNETDCRALMAKTVASLGRLDILVNNAGINIRKQPQEYTLEEWHRVLDTNLTSAFACSQAAYPEMMKAGGGKVINIGSMMSIFGASFTTPYAASKGGMVQMTRAMACAWAKDNIQVNAVLPGWIDTELTRGARKDVAGLHERVLARTPAGRWGDPADFAGIAVFLASAASDFLTGTAIPVDGGYSIQGQGRQSGQDLASSVRFRPKAVIRQLAHRSQINATYTEVGRSSDRDRRTADRERAIGRPEKKSHAAVRGVGSSGLFLYIVRCRPSA